MFHLFSIQKPKGPYLTLSKIGQGHPRVTIRTNLVVLSHLMLHTKFQGIQPSGSREEDFLPYMGIVAILAMRPGPFEQIFNLPLPECCI